MRLKYSVLQGRGWYLLQINTYTIYLDWVFP